MPTVFVANQPAPRDGISYDVSPAMQFGEIRFVFREDLPFPSTNPDWAVEHAREVMADATSEDFLVVAGGDPLGIVIASAVLADMTGGPIRYLRWERARRGGKRVSGGYYAPLMFDPFSNGDNDGS